MSASQTSNGSLRVGYVGTGWTEKVQIPTFRLGGLIAQGICSGHVENAHRVASTMEIPQVYQSWQDMIQSDEIDIVSIATPPSLHEEIAVAALQAGKHVICEKPTALNVEEAERMFAAAQAAPNQMAIIDHELRYHPVRAQMRSLMRDGYVGDILYVTLDRVSGSRLNPTTPWTWLSDADQGGGMLGALTSHLFDLARWMVGRVDALTAQLKTGHLLRTDPATGTQRPVTADDHALLLLKFSSGTQGTLIASGLDPVHSGSSVLAVGSEGALRIDYGDTLWEKRGDGYPNGEWQPVTMAQPMIEMSKLPNNSPFTIGSYYLAKAIRKAHQRGDLTLPEAASFYDGLVVQRALDAARQSQAEESWIRL